MTTSQIHSITAALWLMGAVFMVLAKRPAIGAMYVAIGAVWMTIAASA